MTTVRERWYALHRARRVFRRENEKAVQDALLFGTGLLHVPSEGDPRHIPIEEVRMVMHRVLDMALNPPVVVDPTLRDGGLNMYRPRGPLP